MRLHIGRLAQARLKPSDAATRIRAAGSGRKSFQRGDLQDTLRGPCRHDGGRPDGRLFAGRLSAARSGGADRAVPRSARSAATGSAEPRPCPARRGAKAARTAQTAKTGSPEAARRPEAGAESAGRGCSSSTATAGSGPAPASRLRAAANTGCAVAGASGVLAAAAAELALADSTRPAVVRQTEPARMIARGLAGAAPAFFLYSIWTMRSRVPPKRAATGRTVVRYSCRVLRLSILSPFRREPPGR